MTLPGILGLMENFIFCAMMGLPGLLADAPRDGGGWVGDKNVPLLKICHTSTMMKLGTMTLYLKTIQKIYK